MDPGDDPGADPGTIRCAALGGLGEPFAEKLCLSPQRPLARAYQRDPELVETWMREEYPAIVKQAKSVGAHIYFADEASVRSDYHSGTTWGKVGETPVVQRTGARFKVNVISAVSPRGQLRFMCQEGRLTASVFIEFLTRLLANEHAPVFLIVDGHPVHRSAAVKRFVCRRTGPAAPVPLAALCTRAQSRRAGMDSAQTSQDRKACNQRTRAPQAAHHRFPSRNAKNACPGPPVVPSSECPLRRVTQ